MERRARQADTSSLFVYGTLVRRATLEEVIDHRFDGEQYRARLQGWRRVDMPAYAYAFLVPDPGGVVDGVVLTELSAADMALLDAYEDLDTGMYERVPVQVAAGTCGPGEPTIEAWVYVGGAPLRALAHAGHAS